MRRETYCLRLRRSSLPAGGQGSATGSGLAGCRHDRHCTALLLWCAAGPLTGRIADHWGDLPDHWRLRPGQWVWPRLADNQLACTHNHPGYTPQPSGIHPPTIRDTPPNQPTPTGQSRTLRKQRLVHYLQEATSIDERSRVRWTRENGNETFLSMNSSSWRLVNREAVAATTLKRQLCPHAVAKNWFI